MVSVNTTATCKFVIVLNEKSPLGKLLSATGQLAMSLRDQVTKEELSAMDFTLWSNPTSRALISLSSCSFVVLKGSQSQLMILYEKAKEEALLPAIFTSTMSFNGVEEDLFEKTKTTPFEQVEIYGVGLFGQIEKLHPLTKKFSVFK